MKTNIKKKTDVKATGEKKVKCLENKLLSSLDEKKNCNPVFTEVLRSVNLEPGTNTLMIMSQTLMNVAPASLPILQAIHLTSIFCLLTQSVPQVLTVWQKKLQQKS